MRMAVKVFISFIGLLAAVGAPAQTRVTMPKHRVGHVRLPREIVPSAVRSTWPTAEP
jgi:hypothetical protein